MPAEHHLPRDHDDLSDHPMFRVDRRHIEIADTFASAEQSDRAYWHSRSPQERLLYVEHLRRMNYGRAATERLQRVLEIAEPEPC